jgi:hypothetical protein
VVIFEFIRHIGKRGGGVSMGIRLDVIILARTWAIKRATDVMKHLIDCIVGVSDWIKTEFEQCRNPGIVVLDVGSNALALTPTQVGNT